MAANIPVPNSKKGTKDPKKIIKEPVRVGYYEILSTVGKGNFAVVKLAKNVITNSKVAIKMISKDRIGEENMEKIKREISNMRILTHPNIIQLYQVMETDKMIYLVLEYASGGEIYDKLKSQGKMSEKEARLRFKQIVAAVTCCHSQHIVHRDLKIENLLLDAENNIKLADFGFSKHFTEGTLLSTHCGSLPYAAPELFEGCDYDGPKVDIWSMGVILYTMVVGSLPFDAVNPVSLQKIILTGKIRVPYFMSTECESLIRSMLKINPAKRASLQEVMRHEWMTKEGDDGTFSDLIHKSISGVQMTEFHDDILEQLEGLNLDVQQTIKSVKEKKLNYLYAIYHLLCKKKHSKDDLSRSANTPYRKSSITTGVVSDVDVSSEMAEKLIMQQGTDNEEAMLTTEDSHARLNFIDTNKMVELMCGEEQRSMEAGISSAEGVEDSPPEMVAHYCTMRRHTIGMTDHKETPTDQNDFGLGISGWHKLFEQAATASDANEVAPTTGDVLSNLSPQFFPFILQPTSQQQQQQQPPKNLASFLTNQQQLIRLLKLNESQDSNFLQPPQFYQPGGCGRRASDGGANIAPVQKQTEGIALPPLHHPHIGRMKKEREGVSTERGLEREAIKRYMLSRGYLKRYTLAMTTPTHELSEDIQRKLACNPIKSCRPHLTRERTPHRDSLKDTFKLHLPSDRFSPVRRSSDEVTVSRKYRLERSYSPDTAGLESSDSYHSSLMRLKQEHQQLQKRFTKQDDDKLKTFQDIHYTQSSPRKSPSPSPPNDPSPISVGQNSQDSCLYKHLQMLQLQQQQSNIANVPCACSSCGSPMTSSLPTDAPTTSNNFFQSPFFFDALQAPNLSSIREDEDSMNATSNQNLPVEVLAFIQQTTHDYQLKQQQLQLQNQQQQQQLFNALHMQKEYILQQGLMQLQANKAFSSSQDTLCSHSSQHLPLISITDHSGRACSPEDDMMQDTTPPCLSPREPIQLSYDQALRSALPLNLFLDNNMLQNNRILDADVLTKPSE